jgi:hypothetical protein
MARRIPREPLSAAAAILAACFVCGAAAPAPAEPATELVRYGFDERVATGPDTLRVFQNARGSVRLSSAFRLGGYRSVEIRDAAGDGDFPELLGRFPLRREGRLFAHLALLVADPDQELNVALAGPARFRLVKDGIAFWLKTRGGSLYHVSDSMPKRLVPLRAFVWYAIDVAYDVASGTYDLTVTEEGSRAPLVSLTRQPNAAARPGSAVEVFSFIGDAGEDTSDVVYYVDDVVLAADRPVDLAPFVAPGRRKLFVDAWSEHRRRLESGPACFAAADIADLGIGPRDLPGPGNDDETAVLRAALDPRGPRRVRAAHGELPPQLEAASTWAEGCEALRRSKLDESIAAFARAEALWPRGRIYPLSRALALARAHRPADAKQLLDSIAGELRGDLRLSIADALVGLANDDLEEAMRALASPAQGLPIELGGDVARVAEQYFLVLLWRGSYAEALSHAVTVEARLRELALPTAPWTERIGDAAFFLGEPQRALEAYRAALGSGADALLYEKLADASFAAGDLDQERAWRERVYGSLRD